MNSSIVKIKKEDLKTIKGGARRRVRRAGVSLNKLVTRR